MNKLRIRAIGKLPDNWAKEAQKTYLERLVPFGGLDMIELPEGHKGSAKPDIERTRQAEAASLLKGLSPDDTVIALDETGTQYTSPAFAEKLASWSEGGRAVVFLIGGSWGLDAPVKARANAILSLGKITLPHALARIVLVEQLYRARSIQTGKTYHK